MYIRNKDSSSVDAYCSYSPLKYEQFDEDGNAKRYKLNIQTPFIKAMRTVVDGIVGPSISFRTTVMRKSLSFSADNRIYRV